MFTLKAKDDDGMIPPVLCVFVCVCARSWMAGRNWQMSIGQKQWELWRPSTHVWCVFIVSSNDVAKHLDLYWSVRGSFAL